MDFLLADSDLHLWRSFGSFTIASSPPYHGSVTVISCLSNEAEGVTYSDRGGVLETEINIFCNCVIYFV